MRKSLVAALMTLALAAPLQADFRSVARGLDQHLGSRTFIPFLGFGRFLVRLVHPKGVHDFQMAYFENHRRNIDPLALNEVVRKGIDKDFTPLVRVRGRRENVFVYARARGEYVELMILTNERNETVLVRVVADAEIVGREFRKPRGVVKLAER